MENTVKPKGKRGGRQPGAGRPKGSKETITVMGLLDEIRHQNGVDYDEVLVTDMNTARHMGDYKLLQKYHHIILNKVMTSTTKLEITEGADAIEAKKLAFQEAISKYIGDVNASDKK